MQILGGLSCLIVLAGIATWFMPDALQFCEAKIYARRQALRVQKAEFELHLQRLRENG